MSVDQAEPLAVDFRFDASNMPIEICLRSKPALGEIVVRIVFVDPDGHGLFMLGTVETRCRLPFRNTIGTRSKSRELVEPVVVGERRNADDAAIVDRFQCDENSRERELVWSKLVVLVFGVDVARDRRVHTTSIVTVAGLSEIAPSWSWA